MSGPRLVHLVMLAAFVTSPANAQSQAPKRPAPKRKTPVAQETVSSLQARARQQATAHNYAAALKTMRAALDRAPNATELLYDYGYMALRAGAPTETVRVLSAATRLEADNPQYLYLLGVANLWAGDLEGSSVPLRRLVELEPERTAAHLALALAFHGQKKFDEAAAELDRVLALSPGNSDALYLLADISQTRGDLAQAEALASRVLSQEPRHPGANLVQGMVLAKNGQYEKARSALERASAGDPSDARALYQLSIVYARLNQPARAAAARQQYEATLKKYGERQNALRRLLDSPVSKDTR